MPRLDPVEHKRRKQASALRCLDENGKPLNPESVSVAVQDKKENCNINKIVARATKNGMVDQTLIKIPGQYGDFTNVVDFQEIQNRVIRMNDKFMTLDPKLRMKFDNDPVKLVAYLDKTKTDQTTKEEAISLGILPKPVIKTKKIETPEGNFWVTTKDDLEINRTPIKEKTV